MSTIIKILAEYGREDLSVLYNLSFGHCEPKCCISYGAMADMGNGVCGVKAARKELIKK